MNLPHSNNPNTLGKLKIGAVLILAAILMSPSLSAQASKAYIVIDKRTFKILDGKNYNDKLPVASLTKIVTACVVLDWLAATNGDRNGFLVIPAEAVAQGGANPLNLRAGDQMTIRDAMFSSLMASDNVAAYALANHIGTEMWRKQGGRAKSAVDFFVSQMNALARAKGMVKSKFVNPHGLDHTKSRGHSSAGDMARISAYAIDKPSFNFIVSQTSREIAFIRGNQKQAFRIHNTNKLLGQHGVDGMKTGRTTRAGDCLVTSVRKKDRIQKLEGNRQLRTPYHLIIVTLGSNDRFGQTVNLLHNGWAAYDSWLNAGLPLGPKDKL